MAIPHPARLCRAAFPQGKAFPVGKCYAINIEAEKAAFAQRANTDKYRTPATIIIAAFADMEG